MMYHMNNKAPFYGTQWGIPSHSQQQQQQQQRHHLNKAPSKVVNIPVHFVGSEKTRADSATKIQKVVRGFLVRNTVKRIVAVRVQVEEIEAKVNSSLDVIKRDQRERVRVSETIMNLLLKLDSVRVLDYYSGVRECRKSVIKKAIALQEMVDQMVGTGEEGEKEGPHHGEGAESGSVGEGVETNLVEEEENCLVKEEEEGVCENASEELVADSKGEKTEDGVRANLVEEKEENCLVKEEEEGEKIEGLRNNDDDEEEEEEEEKKMEVEEKEEGDGEEEESVGTSLVEENNGLVKEEEEDHVEEEGGKREGLLEKMVEENERMMGMMARLFEKNEMQTRLLSSLSQRVEQLERAFACDKLRRCKKRRSNADAKQQHK